MKKLKWLAAAIAVLAATGAEAKKSKGNCAEAALSLKASQSAVLVDEWVPGEDGDKGEYLGTGAIYYKVTLQRGGAYTIWITGGDASKIDFDVDIDWTEYDKAKYDKETKDGDDKYPTPGASFDFIDLPGGDTKVAYLYAEDWDMAEDPAKGKYIVSLSGDTVGLSTTLGFSAGTRSFEVVGSEESPRKITFADNKWKGYSGKVIDGDYYFTASLKAGRKYRVRTLGGATLYTDSETKAKKAFPLALDIYDGLPGQDTSDGDSEEEDSNVVEDPAYTNDTYNAAYFVLPTVSGKYTFQVSGEEDVNGKGVPQSFQFKYMAVPTRAIGSHAYMPLFEENGYSVHFTPGRMVNNNSYYDNIIDEHLCRIYLKKGETWVFETSGATQEQAMYLYNSKGSVLATNTSLDGGSSSDTRIVYTASAAGIYYVGVCDPNLDITDAPTGGEINLFARKTTDMPMPDDWDSGDDFIAGGTVITPFPFSSKDAWAMNISAQNTSGVQITGVDTNALPRVMDIIASNRTAAVECGAVHGPHRLAANDYADCFIIPARSGNTYRLRTSFANEGEGSENLTLTATVYYYSSGVRKVLATSGLVTPVTALNNLENDFSFKAVANGPHYVRVAISGGEGLDYPAYYLNAVVEKSAVSTQKFAETYEGVVTTNTYGVATYSDLGYLKVESDGGIGSWTLNKETVAYAPGSVLAMPTNASVEVKFAAVSGYKAPASQKVAVPASADGTDPVVVTGRYTDIYDSQYVMSKTTKTVKGVKKTVENKSHAIGDGEAFGAFAITPAAASKTLNRTLWNDDPGDWFKFTAADGVYYDFTVASASSNIVMSITNTVTGAVVEGTPRADGTGCEILRQFLDAGLCYLVVSHGDGEDKDATYSLSFSKANTGIVRFTNAKSVATSNFSVKEGVEYATLYVARTGTEGAVRVGYATEAGTAKPGERYYPVTNGVVSWKAGDKAAKAIKIRMIPDEIAAWASSNLTFKVKLFPVDGYDLASGEYLARTNSVDTATVTIIETTAKKPGTVSIVSYGKDEDETPVANVKKPAATGKAGETLVLNIARTGGSDGKVSVKVATSAVKTDTAKPKTDYVAKSEVLVWEDGEDGVKQFEIDLVEAPGYATTKKFTLAMSVVKTGFTPALSAKTATVTVKNATADQTAAAFVKQIGAAGLAAATKGTWFQDYDGTLRSAPAAGTITYTLTGPGIFMAKPRLNTTNEEDTAVFTCKFDKEAPVDLTAEDFDGRVEKVFGSGKHTVVFALSGIQGYAYADFENIDGAPYFWKQFSSVAAYEPMAKAYVETNGVKRLAWTMPDELAAIDGLYCRVRFGETAKKMEVAAYDKDRAFFVPFDKELLPSKTYYWAVDYAYTDAESPDEETLAGLAWAAGANWTFTTVADGAPKTVFSGDSGSVDAAGVSAAQRIADGEPVELIQAVKPKIVLGSEDDEANGWRFVAGALPKGLSVNATTGAFTGCPMTPGTYRALLQSYVKTAKTVTKKVNGNNKKVTTYTYSYGTTMPVDFNVLPAGTAIGTFRATVEEQNGDYQETDARHNGTVAFSATAAGKLSATVTIGGVAYKFAGTGYDEIVERDETRPGCTRTFGARLTNTTLLNKKTKKVSYLTVEIADGSVSNAVAVAEAPGKVELDMQVFNTKLTSVKANVAYAGDLRRSSGSTGPAAEAAAAFAGYYTMALAPVGGVSPADGLPAGNGYLLATVSANGAAKITGVLADGTSVSCSTFGQAVGATAENPAGCTFEIPVFAGKTTVWSLAGVLKLAIENEDAKPVVLSSSKLLWSKTASATTSRDATGFGIEQAPTGGWYDKVVNLQKYYLDNNAYAVETFADGDGEELPYERLSKNYTFTASSVPHDLGVRFTGNTIAVDSRKLVKNSTLSIYDFADGLTRASVNPWAVTFKYTRATGVITGTLSAWQWYYPVVNGYTYEYPTKVAEIKKLAHKGVMLFSRDGSSDSPLAENVRTAGFFLMPATTSTKTATINKTWKASLPFNIVETDDSEKTYDELDFGGAEDAGE